MFIPPPPSITFDDARSPPNKAAFMSDPVFITNEFDNSDAGLYRSKPSLALGLEVYVYQVKLLILK